MGQDLSLTKLGDQLLASIAILLAVSAGWLFFSQQYLSIETMNALSFAASDRPLIQYSEFEPTAMVGGHYFGDFQEPLSWAFALRMGIDPYSVAAAYPPTGITLMLPFTLLPLQVSFLLYMTISIVLIAGATWLLLGEIPRARRVVAFCLICPLSLPFLAMFDRGNSIGMTMGLVGLALFTASRNSWKTSAVLLGVAISLKLTPAVLLVIPLARRDWRYLSVALITGVGLTVFSLVLFWDGVFSGVQSYVSSAIGTAGGTRIGMNGSLIASVGDIGSIVAGTIQFSEQVQQASLLAMAVAVFWTIGLYLLARNARVPDWVAISLALAGIHIISPVSYNYNASWAIIAAAWIVGHGSLKLIPGIPKMDRSARFLRPIRTATTSAAIAFSLAPLVVVVVIGDYPLNIRLILVNALLAMSMLASLFLAIPEKLASHLLPNTKVKYQRYRT